VFDRAYEIFEKIRTVDESAEETAGEDNS
jgi:hypothetical protein